MRGKASLKKKCANCRVARSRGGCLFGCTRTQRLEREFQVLIQEANSNINPVTEQLKQCPEAFEAGHLLEQVFTTADRRGGTRLLPPAVSTASPFV
jgi:ribosomal protein L36